MNSLSPLETAVVTAFYDLYRDRGFPKPENVRVRHRENTGSGRYIELDSVDSPQLENGYFDLAGRLIEMEGVPNGLMAVAQVKGHRLVQIELSVYGDDPWDGEERDWRIV